MKGTTLALVLSVIALAVSLVQPTYNLFSSLNRTEPGSPIVQIDYIVLQTFYTEIRLHNNGTAPANNIWVELQYSGPASYQTSQIVPELSNQATRSYIVLYMPIGSFNLKFGGFNETDYTILLLFAYNEIQQPIMLNYNVTANGIIRT